MSKDGVGGGGGIITQLQSFHNNEKLYSLLSIVIKKDMTKQHWFSLVHVLHFYKKKLQLEFL